MPLRHRTTLTQYLIEERRRFPDSKGEFNGLILDVALACKAIARAVAMGELGGMYGDQATDGGKSVNVQGEPQKKLDVLSNELFIRVNEWAGHLAGMASEEMDDPYQIPESFPRGKYMLVFDPLDGSSNIDVNVSVGSIFSILRAPQDVIDSGRDVTEQDFLQPGNQPVERILTEKQTTDLRPHQQQVAIRRSGSIEQHSGRHAKAFGDRPVPAQ
jgi:fructose-1,6-bisphosphatase I/sedoheptulose-1,7-bisphosphatase